MASTHSSLNCTNMCLLYLTLFVNFFLLSNVSFIRWSSDHSSRNSRCSPFSSTSCFTTSSDTSLQANGNSIDLLSLSSSWNHLSFPSKPPPKTLKIALFVKRWPRHNQAGGLERHAQTLHLALAKRGHQIHIFTANSPDQTPDNVFFHLTTPTRLGHINQSLAWEQFRVLNSRNPFDVIHTESVALYHRYAWNLSNVVVSWHGIAYEVIHSHIVQDLSRGPREKRQPQVYQQVVRVINEVKFFQNYAHHVATSDYVGEVLRRIYMVRDDRVHVIVNGVDESVYKKDIPRGVEYRKRLGISQNVSLVFGIAGRLVRDKGHPLMFEAIKQLFEESKQFREKVCFLVAGNGPWGSRYRTLGPNVFVLGPLGRSEMASFYSSIDVFINPTLRAQGLDHTIIEAMMSGATVASTGFISITRSLITGPDLGYTFSPKVDSVKRSLSQIWQDGKEVIRNKGETARKRALQLFTADKMVLAYERLFLCIASKNGTMGEIDYCKYGQI